MKVLTLFFALVLSTLSMAGEHEGGVHTPNVCSKTNAKSCAHLRFDTYPTTSAESKFITHILSSTGAPVTNVKVQLFMDMGHGRRHGSSPVTITEMDELNHFYIENAWFVMDGEWLVVVTYTDNGVEQTVSIPVEIKE